ncbi:glycosyltransferase [Oscillatoria sp. CS-180]|uniref:glycosyltransferase n=1 Tax=Oscillatoria sp. CS-180 TaxID=3021720 RepID=UPI002330BEF9|nr:glycosyltransferase [Oscillatoria sp. CS-180]MDB9527393.1 glycosyltransferase [Oscillatoria sp. CS-180]
MSVADKPEPVVSVIIPVYNDLVRLQKCLQALDNQTYPQELYEIIVVDNGSSESPEPVTSRYESVKLLSESEPGSYAARNTGVLNSRGPILAFTDADCIPDKNWLQAGVECLKASSDYGLVAGRIELFFHDAENPTAVEIYESVEMGFHQAELLQEQHYGLTANLFTYRSVIDEVGLFSTQLKSGGDKEWGQRVFASNYQQVYSHEAYVCHPTRHTFKELYKRVTRIVGGRYDATKGELSEIQDVKALLKDFVLAFTPPGRSILRAWNKKELVNSKQKSQFILTLFFVRYVGTWERIRLRLGGRSRRW